MTEPSTWTGRVMGTDAAIAVVGGALDAASLARRLRELEATWTRFDPESELQRLNRCAGDPVVVSGDLFALVRQLCVAHELTGGRFDPTLLDAIVAAGYDRTYRALPADRDVAGSWVAPGTGVSDITLLPQARLVHAPQGLHLDAGGLGKGLAADLVAAEAVAAGASGVLVDVGGDLRVDGTPPDGGAWRIDTPSGGRVVLPRGGVATSSVDARCWRVGGRPVHHLLDPADGRPLSGVSWVTVVAGAAWWAEALTKAVLVSMARGDGWFDADRADDLGVQVILPSPDGDLIVGHGTTCG